MPVAHSGQNVLTREVWSDEHCHDFLPRPTGEKSPQIRVWPSGRAVTRHRRSVQIIRALGRYLLFTESARRETLPLVEEDRAPKRALAAWGLAMPTTLETAVARYLCSGNPAQRTREEYSTTLRKWARWGSTIPIEELERKKIREFLDWVYKDAAGRKGGNPGRTANKVRSHLRAVMAWAWEQDMVEALPRFPKVKSQRIVAGRHYLTKPEINSLYFATHQMKRPRGWSQPFPIGRYWRSALVMFFNYGLDTGTVWRTESLCAVKVIDQERESRSMGRSEPINGR